MIQNQVHFFLAFFPPVNAFSVLPFMICATPSTVRDFNLSFSYISTVSLPFSITFFVVTFFPFTTFVEVDVDLKEPKVEKTYFLNALCSKVFENFNANYKDQFNYSDFFQL